MGRVFISYDYDNDVELKNALVGQSRLPDSPFSIEDWSVKDESPAWRDDARRRIAAVGIVVVICGSRMGSATGVNEEIRIAKELSKQVWLIKGRGAQSTRPSAAVGMEMYDWTWPTLKILLS